MSKFLFELTRQAYEAEHRAKTATPPLLEQLCPDVAQLKRISELSELRRKARALIDGAHASGRTACAEADLLRRVTTLYRAALRAWIKQSETANGK